ncbi:MAG: hypothetical protein JWP81_3529 [Ferruginibacter sp.]|nr:hypothetical protein [Ferruginibacter sp.]
MRQKNIPKSIPDKIYTIAAFLLRGRLIISVVLALMLLFSGSCKKLKAAAGDQSALEALFEENILNRDFIVALATDNGTDLTSQFTGYHFILTKTTSFYNGQITGTRSGVTYTGTWACNDDFSKLDISITNPSVPPEFIFINRAWRFTKKAVPIMELAPWGSTAPKVLHMQRL